jgi:CRP-like cAMP-binding protein
MAPFAKFDKFSQGERMPGIPPNNSANLDQPIHNKLLLGLSSSERASFRKKLEFMELPRTTVLVEAGQPFKFAYFIESGLASVLNLLDDGSVIEVGLNGSEGFVGLPLLAGLKTSAVRVIMQVGGSGFAITPKNLQDGLKKYPALGRKLALFAQEMTMQAMQVGACNRLHTVEQRLAKWLLMSQDRLGGDFVPLTQEFLSHMLGTRRASVTIGAAELQRRGAISYHRGMLQIKDRPGLEAASCECYSTLVKQFALWASETK